ncbi:hypothetical protein [Bosea massiliensis]|uniref:Uncharacterized protein n=1 Tax=Bosea massiliensis TaxID=151419 RepID=A0ABW0P9W8_9HYPH
MTEGNLGTPAPQWLREQFAFEWCADCGRDHRHHTALPVMGNWFARCEREPIFCEATGELVPNPEGYLE